MHPTHARLILIFLYFPFILFSYAVWDASLLVQGGREALVICFGIETIIFSSTMVGTLLNNTFYATDSVSLTCLNVALLMCLLMPFSILYFSASGYAAARLICCLIVNLSLGAASMLEVQRTAGEQKSIAA